ncbi:hypothetical protein HFO15_01550 [Rhizobium laguerreae]|uniref:hypothetical protein n=1 Tax=Rhizobium laguerreae TaxID=1076926 RepID=UPI001C903D94|nr:hypothetical protein [Rhizobium laguerreae]MBY3260351.1 hypothetical protein [Rhizobium laguerreae]MBY3335659.1 hypothetical protein [Rhizobium laguerreae]
MSFRKLDYQTANFDTHIVISVHNNDGQIEASMHHPFENSTRIGLKLSGAVDLALYQQQITPDHPEIVVIDEEGVWPASFEPLK